MAADTTGITTAARANVPQLGTALSVTPSVYYACSTNIAGTRYTGAQAQTNAEAACTGTANRAVQFLQVSTTASVTPPLKFPLMPATYSLVGNAVVEVQQ
jgi:hypothetical protein